MAAPAWCDRLPRAGVIPPLYSIGYGNRAIGDVLALLMRERVRVLADVRSRPHSRFRPDFDRRRLERHLAAAGIAYAFMGAALGGKPDDPACYRDGRVDYDRLAARPDFQSGLDDLLALNESRGPVAVMCAELKPEACHRARLIGQSLSRRGVELVHIGETGELHSQDEVAARFRAPQADLFAG